MTLFIVTAAIVSLLNGNFSTSNVASDHTSDHRRSGQIFGSTQFRFFSADCQLLYHFFIPYSAQKKII